MTSVDVLDFYRTMSKISVEVWVDGGWGVDALLGKQTRPHKDLDIAIQQRHVQLLRKVLLARGFEEVRLEDAQPWNFVLGDENGTWKRGDASVILPVVTPVFTVVSPMTYGREHQEDAR